MLELYILATIGVYKHSKALWPGQFEHEGKIKGCIL